MAVNWRALIAEFMGTMFLCMAATACECSPTAASWGGLIIGVMLMLQIYIFGPISGGHLNPAVTLGVALSGKMNGQIAHMILYPVCQIVGGIVGCLSVLLVHNNKLAQSNIRPGETYEWYDGCLVEFLYTMMLVTVVLNCACTSCVAGNQFFALAIGFVVVAGGFAGGSISGGGYNPAVCLGKDIASAIYSDSSLPQSTHEWKFYSLTYLGSQLVAGAMASLLFRVVRPEEFGNPAKEKCLSARLISEMVGVFYFCLTIHFVSLTRGAVATDVNVATLQVILAVAAALLSMVYTFGTCSGGHLNPVVTTAVAISGRELITIVDVFLYVAAQFVGAILASFAACALMDQSLSLMPNEIGWGRFIAYDLMMSFLIGYVVLSSATTKNAYKDMFGFNIGFVVVAASGAFSVYGACYNTAVAVGIDFAHLAFKHDNEVGFRGYCGLLLLIEVAGGAAAAGFFRLMRPEEYEGEDEEGEEGEEGEAEEPINP